MTIPFSRVIWRAEQCAEYLGHRDLRTTLNVYFQADMQDVAAKLG